MIFFCMKTETLYDVACVGILCVDVLVKPVDRVPEKGKVELIDQEQIQVGGCTPNAAINKVCFYAFSFLDVLSRSFVLLRG